VLSCLPTEPALPRGENGDFGTWQLSDEPLLAFVYSRLASEWVEEELAKLVQEKPVANIQGTKRFYAALLVSTLAASRTATGRR
jgi:hypothetical protein